MKYLYRDSFRKIYQCSLADLPVLLFSDMNRKVDETRVLEIVNSIPADAKILPSPWIEAYERNGKYFLLDGQHRISALNILQKYRKKMIFYMSVLTSNGGVNPKEEFIRINKNVNVSDLYLEQEDPRKIIYEQVVNYYYGKYKIFFRPSNNPHKPHINKDLFLQILYESNTHFSFDEIITAFTNLSQEIKIRFENDTNPKLKKCRDFNFFLFYSEPFELKKALQPSGKQLFLE